MRKANPSRTFTTAHNQVHMSTRTTRAPKSTTRATPKSTTRTEPVIAESREDVEARLRATPFLWCDDPMFMHGRAYTGPAELPRSRTRSRGTTTMRRAGPSSRSTLRSRRPRRPPARSAPPHVTEDGDVQCGAGISASVIGQAARSGANKQGWMVNTREAQPTPTHVALGILGRAGLICLVVGAAKSRRAAPEGGLSPGEDL